jgi:hypothetical protein
MTIFDCAYITVPEVLIGCFIVVKMDKPQFEKYMKGLWRTVTIFRTPDGNLYLFSSNIDLMIVMELGKKNSSSR